MLLTVTLHYFPLSGYISINVNNYCNYCVIIIIKSRELREQIKDMVSSESFKDVVNRKLDKAFLPSSLINTFWGLSFSLLFPLKPILYIGKVGGS